MLSDFSLFVENNLLQTIKNLTYSPNDIFKIGVLTFDFLSKIDKILLVSKIKGTGNFMLTFLLDLLFDISLK